MSEIIFQHIRNCTAKVTYSGLNILVDPFFTPKGYYPGLEFCLKVEEKKTRVPLESPNKNRRNTKEYRSYCCNSYTC